MDVGIHLPQYGRVASSEAITTAARRAEELGFADVWVSDHIVHPAEQDYPSPFLFDPMVALTWAAAVTERIGLGTSVLVLPSHVPLELANQLASLDALSGGRVTVAGGVGWSEREFDALGHGFADRGPRADEIIDALRVAWTEDPATFEGEHVSFRDVRVLPQPAHAIPIWIGGMSERALRRGVEKGDGHQIIGVKPPEAAPVIERLRRDRPEESFTISLRTGWDPQGMDPDEIRAEADAYAEAGVQHVVSAPWRSDLDSWLRSMELLAELVLDR
ncbi:MAG TPA: LLM class F420-dependent oxidoreductase [Acidimicrobiales bacterium]|nr:LLM class F420-dependent oxidoreductase [Acidimicrobiales bacterium]